MDKTIKCPICNHALDIKVSKGYEMTFNKPLKELPYVVWCDNCKRKIKYDISKKEQE